MGVRLFFVLSGFLITGILLRCRDLVEEEGFSGAVTLRQFYIRRFLRIFPLFYVVLVTAAALDIETVRETLGWHAAYLSNVYFFGIERFEGPTSHFWSLAVEEQFYLLWPMIIMTIRRRWLGTVIAALVAVGPLFRLTMWLTDAHADFANILLPGCLDALGAGALLAVSGDSRSGALLREEQLRRASLIFGLPMFVTLVWIRMLDRDPWLVYPLFDFAIAVMALWLVAAAARGFGGRLRRVLEWRPLLYIGKISYGVYVYHLFVVKGLSALLPPGILIRGFVLGGITVAIASVSWHLLEEPLNGLKRHFPYRAGVERHTGAEAV